MDPKQVVCEQLPARFAEAMAALRTRLEQLEAEAEAGAEPERAKLERYKQRLSDAQSADLEIQIEITGDGGLSATLAIKGGVMNVREGLAEAPLLALRQSINDFRATMEEGLGARFSLLGGSTGSNGEDLAAKKMGSRVARLLAPMVINQLRARQGTIRFGILGPPSGEDWSIDVGLGIPPTDEPTCTVNVAYADYEEIASGRLPPPAAFMAGKIRITGDMTLVMQLATPLLMG